MQRPLPSAESTAMDAAETRRRMDALARHGLLDSLSDIQAELDDLVSLATSLCDAPIAALNLLGERHQLFIAERGLGVSQMPLERAFCTLLQDADGADQVPDLGQDARFADNPLVADPAGLRFYAGAPLRDADGVFLGALCVLDWQARNLPPSRLAGLEALARQALRLFERRRVMRSTPPVRTHTFEAAHYHALVDVNPQVVWFARPDGTFDYANRYWYDFSGLDPAAPDPDLWLASIHPEHRQELLQRWREVRKTHQAGTVEVLVRNAASAYRWFEIRTMPFANARGDIERWVGVAQDIDQRKRTETALRESEAFARLLLESTHEGFCALDRDGCITLCNRAFRQMLGDAEQTTVLGERLAAWLGSTRGAEPAQTLDQAAATGAALHVPADTLQRRDGSLLPVEWRGQPLWRDGALQGILCTFIDLTERVRHHDRQRFLLELGDLLHGVTHTGEVANLLGDSLGRLLDVQRVGYARVAHDGRLTIDSDWLGQGRTRRLGLPSLTHWHTSAIEELQRGVIVSFSDSRSDPRLHLMRDQLESHGVLGGLVVPLLAEARLVGLLFLYTDHPRTWTEEDMALVREVAERIRIVVERTAAAEALRLAEQRVGLAMDVADLGIWDYDIDRDLISWDDRLAYLVGTPRQRRTRGLRLLRALHPADAPRVRAYVTAATQSQGGPYDLRLTFRVHSPQQSEPIWLSVRGRERLEADGRRRLVGIARDITRERLDAERIGETNRQLRRQIEERRQAEARQQALIELGDRLREGDAEGAGVALALHLVGTQLGAARVGYARLDDLQASLCLEQAWRSGGQTDTDLPYPALSACGLLAEATDGNPLVIDDVTCDPRSQAVAQRLLDLDIAALLAVPLYESGRPQALLLVHDPRVRLWNEAEVRFVRDVTDCLWAAICRQRSLDAQHESERRFRRMADSAPVLIWACDDQGRLQFVNQRFTAVFGLASDDLARHGWDALLAEEDRPAFAAAFAQAIDQHGAFRAEVRVQTAQGRGCWLRLEGTPRLDADGHFHGLVGCAVDVTDARQATDQLEQRIAERTEELGQSHARLLAEIYERERAEEALRQSQKMEAIGQLTGGIAHDFNNMLTGIVGALDLIRLRVANGRVQDLDRYINAAVNSADRAAALTHRLLAFARRQTLDPQPVDVHRLIESLEDLLTRTVGENVCLRLALTDTPWLAHSDAHQLENALLNLVINGRDAMPAGGVLTIATTPLSLDAEAARREAVEPGDYLCLSVSDTGTGMPPEVKAKAFEPFFTTKPPGQGTGLGLSMIYGFVKQSGGSARIDSEPDQGTTISLYLPRHADPVGSAPQPPPSATAPRAEAGQTVLLVEDEYAVRMIVLEVLAELGYTVLEAADADGALPIIESDQRLDLLVSDVGLPGMNGRQLAEVARRHRPALKVLFITGYAKNAAVRSDFLGENMDMLTKPFDIDALAQRIHGMIQS